MTEATITEEMVRTRVVRHAGGIVTWEPARRGGRVSRTSQLGMYHVWRSVEAYRAGEKHVEFKVGRFDESLAQSLIERALMDSRQAPQPPALTLAGIARRSLV